MPPPGHAVSADDAPKSGLCLASFADPPASILRERECVLSLARFLVNVWPSSPTQISHLHRRRCL